jgi:hypothetical protein
LNSKTQEEVKKRRGKPSPVNIYQWLVLLAGAIALVVAIWKSPASIPAISVIGATLLIFLVLKDYNSEKDKGKIVNAREVFSSPEKKVDIEGLVPPAKDKEINLQEMLCEFDRKEKAQRPVSN